jgi:hypothetical protein
MMKWSFLVAGCFFLQMPLAARAQTTFDALEQDLKEAKQKHDEASTELIKTFFATLDTASQSAPQALDLYKNAGGSLPDAAPVRTRYEYETPSEKAIREAQDAANFSSVAVVIQVHCGLMRYAALMTVNPKAPGLHDDWINWLKTTGQIYPQLAGRRALKDVAMRDSVISNYLGFHGWGDGDPGKWRLSDLPQLYRQLILEPARTPPTPTTLDCWDTYTAMCSADEPDREKWAKEDEPVLDFDRGSDDFAMDPSMEKLTTLMAIIKDNPTHSQLDNWIARMRVMIQTYRNGKPAHSPADGGTPTPAPAQ